MRAAADGWNAYPRGRAVSLSRRLCNRVTARSAVHKIRDLHGVAALSWRHQSRPAPFEDCSRAAIFAGFGSLFRLFTLPAGIDIAVFGLLRERIADAEARRADLAVVAAASAAPETAAAAEAISDVPRDGDGGDSPRLRAASPEPAEVCHAHAAFVTPDRVEWKSICRLTWTMCSRPSAPLHLNPDAPR